jgi:hypothetical protein
MRTFTELYLYILGVLEIPLSSIRCLKIKGAMLLYGIGYSHLTPRLSTLEKEELTAFVIDEAMIRIDRSK